MKVRLENTLKILLNQKLKQSLETDFKIEIAKKLCKKMHTGQRLNSQAWRWKHYISFHKCKNQKFCLRHKNLGITNN